ncbi:helix-turn-helix transcriptional regulator, partial [Thermoguttaceae bacterium LCP21S3_D4]
CIMQIWAEPRKSALPICNYSQILYQFLTFTQNLKRSRHFNNSIRIDNSRAAETIDMAIAYFNEHYSESISIEEYAQKIHVSTSWFIRNFKLYAGSTPMHFILQKRICNAEALLLNTEYNINEIAQIVGYDNALYFSRIFKVSGK